MKLFAKRTSQPTPRRRSQSSGGHVSRANEQDLEQRYAFRRNRTLTGSLSSEVESAKVHKMELRSARVQGHDLKAHRRRLTLVLVSVLVGIAGLGYLIYESIAQPKVVATSAVTRPIDGGTYEQKINDYLTTHPLQRLRSTLDTTALTAYLQSHGAPEVATVDQTMSFAGFGASKVGLSMRRPVVVWHTGSHVFYVDELGNTFERNYFADPTVQVVDKTGIQANGGQVLASNRFLGFLGKIIGRMKQQNYDVLQVVLPENTSRQVEVMLGGVDYPVKLSVDRSAGEQAEDTARAIRYLQEKGITPQYLDVRVSGKAYYQ